MNTIITPVLAKLVRRVDIEGDEIETAFGEILAGARPTSRPRASRSRCARRARRPPSSPRWCARLRFATTIEVADGAIDTCGTGGDRACTVNVSTIAALIAAGAGARVVKHGNRAASSQCGSADVLEALGVPIELGPAGVERCVAEVGIGFCLAQRYHPALRFMGPARRELGVPTTFNFLGPLANPARVRRQAVGVSDPAMAERVVAVLDANGAEHAWVFHGDDGLDELTTTTTSTVYELRDGEVRRFTLDPTSSGIARAENAISPAATRRRTPTRCAPCSTASRARCATSRCSTPRRRWWSRAVRAMSSQGSSSPAAVDSGAGARVLDDWLRVAAEARRAEEG